MPRSGEPLLPPYLTQDLVIGLPRLLPVPQEPLPSDVRRLRKELVLHRLSTHHVSPVVSSVLVLYTLGPRELLSLVLERDWVREGVGERVVPMEGSVSSSSQLGTGCGPRGFVRDGRRPGQLSISVVSGVTFVGISRDEGDRSRWRPSLGPRRPWSPQEGTSLRLLVVFLFGDTPKLIPSRRVGLQVVGEVGLSSL